MSSDTPPRINKLSNHISSQIAAGEVVQRPASAVKELVENALDAYADKIIIHIDGAGNRLIKIRDNGVGIHPDDMLLALDRHATSKLKTISDLNHLMSFGFRGEALPSIVSVSRAEIVSKAIGEPQGWGWQYDKEAITPASHPQGTTVWVRDLFYNTPARRKFLKTEKTEFLHILAVLKAIALCRLETSFKLFDNKRLVADYPVGDFDYRVADVLGQKFLHASECCEFSSPAGKLWGRLGSPEVARNQSDRQFLFVNGRLVRDRNISHAIRVAYQDRLPSRRQPSYVLHLETDPEKVDINVHPSKQEVKFQHVRAVHDLVYDGLSLCFRSRNLLDENNANSFTAPQGRVADIPPPVQIQVPPQAENNIPHSSREDMSSPNEDTGASAINYTPPSYRAKQSYSLPIYRVGDDTSIPSLSEPISGYVLSNNGRYLLAQDTRGICLMDIYLARQQWAYDTLLQGILGEGVKIKPLSIAISDSLSENKLTYVTDKKSQFLQLGFDLEQIGPELIRIKGCPEVLPYADLVSMLNEVCNFLASKVASELASCAEGISQIMANHTNDSSPDYIEETEMIRLLEYANRTLGAGKTPVFRRYINTAAWERLLDPNKKR